MSGVSRLSTASARLLILSDLEAAVGCRGRLTSSRFPLFLLQGETGDPGPPGLPAYSPYPSVAKGLCRAFFAFTSPGLCGLWWTQSHELGGKTFCSALNLGEPVS